jgi:hypothetical protein
MKLVPPAVAGEDLGEIKNYAPNHKSRFDPVS